MPPATRRKIEYIDLDEIQPADKNPKDHDEELIGASIDRFGFVEPGVLDERTMKLVAGHGRTDKLRAMRAAGALPPEGIVISKGKWLVPVVRGWTSVDDDQAHKLGIALNRSGEKGGWKVDELYDMLDAWAADGDDLTGLGFDTADLDDMMATMQESEVAFDPEESYASEGAHAEPDMKDRAQQYARKGIRSLVLDYKLADFDLIAATCARLRAHRGIDTNAELIQRLVVDAGKELPAE